MPPRLPLTTLPRLSSSLPTTSTLPSHLPSTSRSNSKPLSTTATTTSEHKDAHAAADHHHGAHEEWYESDSSQQWYMGVPPGEKYKKEGWENVTYWGLGGGLIAAAVAYAYKPDSSIQTWALEEARRRLEKEGILPDPDDLPKKS